MNRTFKIPTAAMNYLYDCYTQSPILHMCSHLITTQLLNNGISFCVGECKKKNIKMDAKMKAEVEETWIPFCKDVIDSVLCYGFVAVTLENGVPQVLNLTTYQIEVNIEPAQYNYRVMSVTAVEEELPSTMVFDHFGFRMTPNGAFTSIVHKVIPRLLFLKRLRETALSMEMTRAENTVFSEIKESTTTAQKEGVDYDYYADNNSAEIREDMKYDRNKANVGILNQQLDLYDKYLNKNHAKKSQKNLENVVPLPNGHHMQAPPQNTGRGDLSSLHKSLIEDVCSCLGVPRSMIMAEGSGGLGQKNDTEGQHEVFQHTIMWWKRKLGSCLSQVYNILNAKQIKKQIDFSKIKDIHEAKAKHSVSVYFPVTPFVSNESIRKLYEEGVISWQTYAKYALSNISLPDEDLNTKWSNGPPIDEILFERPPSPVLQMQSGGGQNLNAKRKADEGKKGGEKKQKN